MGRPPIGKKPMSAAERQRRRRELLGPTLAQRIEMALMPGETRGEFLNTAAERELARRERKPRASAAKRKS